MDKDDKLEERHLHEMEILSSRVNIENFISDDELASGLLDDEAIIIYPQLTANIESDSSYFMVSEFTKYDKDASEATVDKIKRLHIPQLERVRMSIKKPIVIRSAARSYAWEISKGRSGKSQHVYKSGFGAVDISISDYGTETLNELQNAVMDETSYTRVTRYPSFLHLDFAENRFGMRGFYKNTKYGWIYIGEIQGKD